MEFSNFSSPSSLINLYTDASWIDLMVCSGQGFITTTNSGFILIVGSLGLMTDSPITTEIVAVNFTLDNCFSRSWLPNKIFSDYPGIARLLKHFKNCVAWILKPDIDSLHLKLNTSPCSDIITINLEDNQIADALANHTISHSQLSLYF